MSTPNRNLGKDMGAAKARLFMMEQAQAWLREQREKEERELEAEIVAKAERVQEEERKAEEEKKAEVECRRAAELAK